MSEGQERGNKIKLISFTLSENNPLDYPSPALKGTLSHKGRGKSAVFKITNCSLG